MDFGEFLTFKNISFAELDWKKSLVNSPEYDRLSAYYEEYVRFGGFPQVVLAGSEAEKHDFLLDIMSSYVNIDIRSLADFSDERNLYSLAKLLASRVGSRVEYSKLASLTGLSRPTVTNYVGFFEKTYLINTVPVYTRNTDREIVKARKLYFCDTGLANTLADLSGGSQFENSLFNQLARKANIQYYALKTGQEIDFVVDGKIALEAKQTPTLEDLHHLQNMAARAKLTHFRLIGRHLAPKFKEYIWAGSIT